MFSNNYFKKKNVNIIETFLCMFFLLHPLLVMPKKKFKTEQAELTAPHLLKFKITMSQ